MFHTQRRTKLTIKQYLSKMGFLMLRDGTLEVKGDSKPEIKDVEEILLEMASQFEMSSTFKKPDYFGKFGKIHKVVINHSTQYAGSQLQVTNTNQ